MAGSRSQPATLAGLAAVSATTTLVSLSTWAIFTESFGSTLWPLVLIAIAIAGSGAIMRWYRVPGIFIVAIQAALGAIIASSVIARTPIPIGTGWERLVRAFTDAVESANRFAPPVPSEAPPVHAILIVGGLATLLLVDVFACTLRRAPLAGLPLLTIYSVPVSMTGEGPHWFMFVLGAVGFLSMVFLSETELVARWGPVLAENRVGREPTRLAAGAWPRTGARAIGGVATALAIVVPLALPSFSVTLFNFGPGAGGNDDEINIENPMLDLRRDLVRGPDVALLTVTTTDPDPSYLRIGVLNRFVDGNEWSSGDRDVPTSQVAEGQMPSLIGVSATVPRTEYRYGIEATSDFRSTWLPTTSNVSAVDAPGDWRYDLASMDFLASDDDLDTSRLGWALTGVKLDYDATRLAEAPPSGSLVARELTELPDDLDPIVASNAAEVTANAPSRFEKAVALQNWFRTQGDFVYDDSVNLSNGADDLVRFLTPGDQGRRGYCEQFAAAMAVMARSLGIPARVAVGFLNPEQVGVSRYVYSAHDLHAWPELFFSGAGWVRFEPTPGNRASDVPGYTTAPIEVGTPTTAPSADASADAPIPGRESSAVDPTQQEDTAAGDSQDGGLPWPWILGAIVLVAVVLVVVLGPRTVRRRRREQRGRLGPESAWAELRDTVVDLGLAWPAYRSPRQTREQLVGFFGAPPDDYTPERPRRGADTNPDAVAALDLLVLALERLRYARDTGAGAGTWRAEMELCVEALAGGAPRRARRFAAWWPRSVFAARPAVAVIDTTVTSPSAGRVVDHVG